MTFWVCSMFIYVQCLIVHVHRSYMCNMRAKMLWEPNEHDVHCCAMCNLYVHWSSVHICPMCMQRCCERLVNKLCMFTFHMFCSYECTCMQRFCERQMNMCVTFSTEAGGAGIRANTVSINIIIFVLCCSSAGSAMCKFFSCSNLHAFSAGTNPMARSWCKKICIKSCTSSHTLTCRQGRKLGSIAACTARCHAANFLHNYMYAVAVAVVDMLTYCAWQ